MSLNKWFNVPFFLQNIKKSRMTIALLFAIVPIFTSLTIIAADNYVFDFGELCLANILGMYVIPFVFSVCLFGYVFKKNSVDFMGSMPISRKSVFVTNTIGGILLIALMQFITFLLTICIGSLTKQIIFTSMAWDIFVFQTIAYIFVFVVANLAMSLSGNVMTQIAVTMLIVFLVPFSVWYVEGMSSHMNYQLMDDTIKMMSVQKIQSFTAPFLIAGDGDYQYNAVSMWKMIVLIVVYIVVGYICFLKKKMEVAEESFEKKWVHFMVKGLTLLPFVAILKGIDDSSQLSVSAIMIAIILVYYFIYDLVTGKKMKVGENILMAIVSIAVIYGIYSAAIEINENVDKTVDINKVGEMKVTINNVFYANITDKELIQKDVALIAQASDIYSDTQRYHVNIQFIKNDGTKYEKDAYVNGTVLQKMFDESYQNQFVGEKLVLSNNQVILTEKEISDVIRLVNETLPQVSFKEIIETRNNSNSINVILNTYKDHQLVTLQFPIILHQELQKIMIEAYNRYAIKCLQNGSYYSYYMVDSYGKFNEETQQKIWFAIDHMDHKEISNWILEHEKEIPEDISKCIRIGNYQFSFYTDKVEDFLTMINRVCEENEEELKAYVDSYERDFYEREEGYAPEAIPEEMTVQVDEEELTNADVNSSSLYR